MVISWRVCFMMCGFGCKIAFGLDEKFEYECDILQKLEDLENKAKTTDQLVTDLRNKVKELENQNEKLAKQQGNSVYIRWGKTSCPGNETSLVYKGFAAGNHHSQTGGGVNTLCLPDDPSWNEYIDAPAPSLKGHIYGVEFDGDHASMFFGTDYNNHDVPCAMCKTQRSNSIMIPGRASCYTDWSHEYTGYLISGGDTFPSNTDYICLDANPDSVARGKGDNNDHVMYLTEVTCTSLLCPPYVNGRELACVVCSQ